MDENKYTDTLYPILDRLDYKFIVYEFFDH